MMLCDFHIHSKFSDGKMTIPEVVDFYGKKGFGAIAITDHLCENISVLGKAAGHLNLTLTPANFPIYLEIIKSENERALKTYGMMVIPGFEITKNTFSNNRSAHFLALGVEEFIPAELSNIEIIKKIRELGGVSVAAHPSHTQKFEPQTYHLWNNREEFEDEFDAWEVANGPVVFDNIKKSNLPKLANTDLHSANQINGWKTIIDGSKDLYTILDAIKKQKLRYLFYESA